MIEIPLRLQFSSYPERPACARFIPGSDPGEWLNELTTWDVPLETLRLYPLSKSKSDNTCIGVLVATAKQSSNDSTSAIFQPTVRRPQIHPYGRIAGRLFLPVEAALSVTLRDNDWAELLQSGSTEYVWHPQAGLVAFEPDEILTVTQLLSPLAPSAAADNSAVDWGWARPGVMFTNRIGSIRAELPPTAATMLADGRDGIGTQARQFKDLPIPAIEQLASGVKMSVGLLMLPFMMISRLLSSALAFVNRRPAPSVTGNGLVIPEWVFFIVAAVMLYGLSTLDGQALVSMLIGFVIFAIFGLIAAAVFGISSLLPVGVSSGQGWFDGWGRGLQQQLAKLRNWSAGLLDSRRREIDRLKKLLDEDPDEGLKYALPFGGNRSLGVAPPTGWLAQRLVDFQLGGYAGTAPADQWDLPHAVQLELMTRYRQLAAREVQLGRYRRAAYIFAELLGDLNAAATTLVNGRFYREAAVLYRDKLNRPLDAARCLEQGGLLAEAIPLYRQQGMTETVGDLYRRLEDDKHAEQAYHEAAETALSKHDHINAARVYQEKLRAPDSALEALDAGWPDTNQSRLCLDATFVLLAKLGRHDEVTRRIKVLEQASLEPSKVVDVVEVLATTATRSPHANSRFAAADTVRILASRSLQSERGNRHQLTAAVSRLAPEDRLLARDCHRAMQQSFEKRPEKTPAVSRPSTGTIRVVKTFQLPRGVTWTSTTGTDQNFYAVGHKSGQLIVARGAWADPQSIVSEISWKFDGDSSDIFICPSRDGSVLFLGSRHYDEFECREFTPTDVNRKIQRVSTPSWMPTPITAIAVAPGGTIYTFQLGEMLLSGYSSGSGSRLMSETVDIFSCPELIAIAKCCMVALPSVVIAAGQYLVICQTGGPAIIREVRQPVLSLSTSPSNLDHQLAVLFEEGGELLWGNVGAGKSQRFGDGVMNPQAVILRSGHLVVHGTSCWEIYDTRDEKLELKHQMKCEIRQESLGLLATGKAGQVGLVTSDGVVRVYELPTS